MESVPSLDHQVRRQSTVYRLLEDRIKDVFVRPRVTQKIIDEHKKKPIGMHSDELERVLVYLRRNHLEISGKLIIVCTKPHEEWRIAELSNIPHMPPVMREESYKNRNEAEHGVFVLRLKAAGLTQ